MVIITQRAQGLTAVKLRSPIENSSNSSSRKALPPLKTILGRKRLIGTGISSRVFSSSRDDCPIISVGYSSAKDVISLLFAYRLSTCRLDVSGIKTSLQYVLSTSENHWLINSSYTWPV